MKTILIVGSNGFIGRNIKERLEKDGYNVICFDRKLDTAKHFYPNDIDIVINCAGEIRDTAKMFGANISLLYNLLFLSKTHGVKKFIHLGSSSEIGYTEIGRSENDVCVPKNMYQGTKAAATMLCQGFAGEYDFDVAVARPFTIYGKYEQDNRFIPTLWNSFLNDKQINLYPGTHDWVYVDDFVDGILLIMNADKQKTKGEIYHFGLGYAIKNSFVLAAFENAIGKKLNVLSHSEKYHDYDCENWRNQGRKTRDLGWNPKITLEQGIKKYIDWQFFEKNPSVIGEL